MSVSSLTIKMCLALLAFHAVAIVLWLITVYYTYGTFVGGALLATSVFWFFGISVPRMRDAWGILKMALNSHEQHRDWDDPSISS